MMISMLSLPDIFEDDEGEGIVVLHSSLYVDALDAPEPAHLVVDHALRHLTGNVRERESGAGGQWIMIGWKG